MRQVPAAWWLVAAVLKKLEGRRKSKPLKLKFNRRTHSKEKGKDEKRKNALDRSETQHIKKHERLIVELTNPLTLRCSLS